MGVHRQQPVAPEGEGEGRCSEAPCWLWSGSGMSCSTISAELIRPCTATGRVFIPQCTALLTSMPCAQIDLQ